MRFVGEPRSSPLMALLKSPDVGRVVTSRLRTPAAGLGCTATKVSKVSLTEAGASCKHGEVHVFCFRRGFESTAVQAVDINNVVTQRKHSCGCGHGRFRVSGKDVLNHRSVDIGQAEIPSLIAVCQLTMVNPELIQQGGL